MVSLTPLDIQNKEFKRSFRGYDENEVEDFLDAVLKDYEYLYKENLELKENINALKERIEEYKQLEETLRKTLVVAQEAAEGVKNHGQREAEMIIEEAKRKSSQIIDEAEWKVEKLNGKFIDLQRQMQVYRAKMKALLMAQMELLDGEAELIATETQE